jgi:hypothetical protein
MRLLQKIKRLQKTAIEAKAVRKECSHVYTLEMFGEITSDPPPLSLWRRASNDLRGLCEAKYTTLASLASVCQSKIVDDLAEISPRVLGLM